MARARTIAIDGPAASGKSTVALRVAKALGYLFLDTGVMYRAVTLAAQQEGIDTAAEAPVAALAGRLRIDVRPASKIDGRLCDVFLGGKDVTWAIRAAQVDAAVSQVSMYSGVRQAMTGLQREIGARGDVVMAGRDIGTVVLPDADLKVYLDASLEERARRRASELAARRQPADFAAILKGLEARDRLDSTRELAPLKPAADGVVLDTTRLTVEGAVAEVLRLAEGAPETSGQGSMDPSTTAPSLLPRGLSGSYDHGRMEARRNAYRWILRRMVFPLFVKIKRVDGLEHLPAQGPAILMINHIAFIDPVALLGVLPRNVVPMAKAEAYDIPVLGWMPRMWQVIPVRRGEVDREALRRALAVLAAGEVLIVAPEGTRSPALIQAREGIAYLAHRSSSPIVPVAIEGTEGFPAPWPAKAWRGAGAEIRLGTAFRFRPLGRTPDRAELRLMTDEAMYVLAEMLPAHRRGHYHDLGRATQHTLDCA
ncbi:MAG: (d)CMP kinase [Anaerolineales bacterium]|nr:(d)CMP kinase [Anaerolineales bacterium]